jgi:O-methyltransferase involved in polyketide biosynthesis
MGSSTRISPTAHYTGWVWYRNGLSDPALASREGRLMHAVLRPSNLVYARLGKGTTLDAMLLARHRVLDHLLSREIEAGRIGQVIEIASGLSPRGLRFTRRFPQLTWVDGDLAPMAAEKRRRLASVAPANLRIETLDALADDGAASLDTIASTLDPDVGTAIITEGLLPYFDRPAVEGMWRRFTRTLRRFPVGLYLSDLNMGGDAVGMRATKAFQLMLSAFARGRVHLHFGDAGEVAETLRASGFETSAVHSPTDFAEVEVPMRERRHLVRIIEAWVRR